VEFAVAIVLTCECGRKLQIKDEFAGQEGQCPACGRTLHIPSANTENNGPPLTTRAVPVEESIPEALPPERNPDDEITDHGGRRLSSKVEFFADPPAEIGPIFSAYTTLREGKKPYSLGARLLGTGVAGSLGLGLGVLIVLGASVRNEFWQVVWPVGLTILIAGLALLATNFSHTSTYVGRDGVARFKCRNSRENVTAEVFRFRDATELRTSQTVHYVNGVYQNTTYSFQWTDVGGRTRYTIAGQHRSKQGNPPSTDAFHFARAAEFAWTYYLLGEVHQRLGLGGSVAFNLKGGHWVRLAPSGISFCVGGEPEEWDAADIAAAHLEQGMVRIKRNDAREGWFSSSGVLKFPFDSLANAQLFFHLLQKLVGVPVV
jgi:hypothetical protein